jgi:phosphoadenosine phosphosulfate reductase
MTDWTDEDVAAYQINLDGRSKVDESIQRLQEYEPAEGYYLAFSGGKDSIVLYDLAVKSGVKFDAHYSQTGIDPPELVAFIREHYPAVAWDKPKERMWSLIERKGLPTRRFRFCCQVLKERGGRDRTVVTGIRSAESTRRMKRQMVENSKPHQSLLHPMIDWLTEDVWGYIRANHLPYCSLYDEGFGRLGCVLCPMTSTAQAWRDRERWAKIGDAWVRAGNRFYARSVKAKTHWSSGEAMFNWWMSREPLPKPTTQMHMEEE